METRTYGDFARREAKMVIGGCTFVVREMPLAPWEVVFEIVADNIERFMEAVGGATLDESDDEKSKRGIEGIRQVMVELFGKRLPEIGVLALTWSVPGRESKVVLAENFKALPDGYEPTVEGFDQFLRENCIGREFIAILEAFLDVNDPAELVGKISGLVQKVAGVARLTDSPPAEVESDSSIPSSVH
jgi:hypothetical protein